MIHKKYNISIVWDFDKTLTPVDSTTELIKIFLKNPSKEISEFWRRVKSISGTKAKRPMDSISTSDAPVWMFMLSELAKDPNGNPIRLDKKKLKEIIAHKIAFYPEVLPFLQRIKKLSNDSLYQENNIEIHHFIITAGLADLVLAVFEYHNADGLIKTIFGCKYNVITQDRGIKNIPIYCMDKTAKTRALFEICKGCFLPSATYSVDDLVSENKQWCPFENMIYIGDGDTDIPAFSLMKARKGMTIGVFDPSLPKEARDKKAKKMREGKRIDLLTPAHFEEEGELDHFIKIRCHQIAKRYSAHKLSTQ